MVPVLISFEPNLILISDGFDACIGDSIGKMILTPYCYGHIMNNIMCLL